jgi:hypothetical protein
MRGHRSQYRKSRHHYACFTSWLPEGLYVAPHTGALSFKRPLFRCSNAKFFSDTPIRFRKRASFPARLATATKMARAIYCEAGDWSADVGGTLETSLFAPAQRACACCSTKLSRKPRFARCGARSTFAMDLPAFRGRRSSSPRRRQIFLPERPSRSTHS